ncbi:MAG: lysophospholipid acyltransferase family protein [Desulfobacterales bacterium]|nr:lysophospholipid acyltransferase family protein [Desulfobacteraceae bacterium]MBT7697281.1 lysophospholipid acyltransferase family protein [Desulfobacterales bacterium]
MPVDTSDHSRKGKKQINLSTFLQHPVNVLLLTFLPNFLTRIYLGILGTAYFIFASSERKKIKIALKYSQRTQNPLGCEKKNWRLTRSNIIDHYHEKLFLAFKSYNKVIKTLKNRNMVKGIKLLDQTLAGNKGAILVTGHYGAVEFIPGILSILGYPVTVMVHCKSKKLRKVLEEKSRRSGIELLDPKSGSVFFSAVKHLKQGRILITQCDELDMWKTYKNKKINFLGLQVGLDKSLDLLALKSKAPVLFGLNHRLGHNRYELEIENPEMHPSARRHELISTKCLKVLESYIYSHPEAWYEWKKIEPFIKQTGHNINYANKKSFSLSGKMAVHTTCSAQPCN